MRWLQRILVLVCLGLGPAVPAFGQSDHLLISEFVVTPTDGEFIEIFNPTFSTIDLSNYYLTDDVSTGNPDYVKVVNGAGALTVANFDFLAKFPDGASIAPGGVKVVAFTGAGFKTRYGVAPDYEVLGTDTTIADMIGIAVSGTAGLTNDRETIVLFTWDGVSDLVQDVDYVVWGDKSTAVDKSGLAIDGPDADSNPSSYKNDTPVASQTAVNADNDVDSAPHDNGSSAARNAPEAGEKLSSGNGITGHDETSENFSFAGGSWTEDNTPTPGTVPDGLANQPAYFMAVLNGSQEVPALTLPATGGGYFVLNDQRDELRFYLSVTGLSGPITAAHFHNAAAGVTGPPVRTLTADFQGEVASGSWKSTDAEPLTPALVNELLAGNIYVNVHTTAHPNGEIRGQVVLGSERQFTASLTGQQEVPPVNVPGKGVGKFRLNATGTQLQFEVAVNDLSGPLTAAHFHNAATGVNGPPVRTFTTAFTGGTATGVWSNSDTVEALTPALVAELLATKLYVNVHTAANPSGEVRGQIRAGAETVFLAVLEGKQENPAVATTAAGGGYFVLNAEQTALSFLIKVRNLSGPITAAHFHLAPRGSNGSPVRTLTADFTDTTASGVWRSTDAEPLTPALVADLLAGNLYVNVHTAAHPEGEIRGQLESGKVINFEAQIEGSQEVPPVATEAAGIGYFKLNAAGTELSFNVGTIGLSGAVTAAHFHNANRGVTGPAVRTLTSELGSGSGSGVWKNSDAEALTPALVVELLAGTIYINFHTAANPAGEIRGQLLPGFRGIAPIGVVRQMPDGTEKITISGIITTVDFRLSSTNSSEFYLQDATGGIRMFVGSGKSALSQGTRVLVKDSRLGTNAGRRNVETVPDSIVVIDQPGLPAPQVVTVAEYVSNRAAIEGELIRVNQASIIGTFPPENSDRTLTINDGTGELAMFIDRDTDIDGSLQPPNPVSVIGVATSFNNTPQIQPSRRSDFKAPAVFFATLSGSQEVPAVATPAQGGGMFVLNEDQTALSFHLSVIGLSGPITAAHFHHAASGANGPVVRDIAFTDGVASGTWSSSDPNQPLTPALLAELLAGNLYVNVHTAAHPGGEIRGQVLRGTAINFTATLNGSQEVPPVTTPANGSGSFTLNATGTELSFSVTVNNLSSAIAAAHFHNAPAGVNGPPVRTITADFSGNTAGGVWRNNDPEPLTPALVAELLAGKIYVNVHTATNPGGEVRGQLRPGAVTVFHAVLNGAQENPAVTTVAAGGGRFVLNEDRTQLAFKIKVANLSGPITAAHFHNAAAGTNGPVVRDLAFTDTVATGVWSSSDASQPLTPALVAELLAGNLYVNVHTAAHPGGEIRGQVLTGAAIKFAAQLEGSQEVPPVTTNAAGYASITLDASGTELAYEVRYTGLRSAFRAAHFHNAGRGKNGPVVRDIPFTGTAASGVWKSSDTTQALTTDLVVELLASQLYVNVHSADHPGGEIRGQLIPGATAIVPIAIARETANGTVVTVEGIVTRALGRFARLQDATAGITAFQTSGSFRAAIDSGKVRLGDRLRLTGTLTEFNSLKEIAPISSFEVISRDNALPTTQKVTLAELGLDPEQVLTVASILEYEANKSEDYPRVARVLYNRLDDDMALQLDSTVSYVSGRSS
ncbi:MAG: endolytic transglycosylase MltG, partial [candidate division KSB1 bacterium]|nr:endolytic transglycosylase MltG [candidate division KSB1 bacterium]